MILAKLINIGPNKNLKRKMPLCHPKLPDFHAVKLSLHSGAILRVEAVVSSARLTLNG